MTFGQWGNCSKDILFTLTKDKHNYVTIIAVSIQEFWVLHRALPNNFFYHYMKYQQTPAYSVRIMQDKKLNKEKYVFTYQMNKLYYITSILIISFSMISNEQFNCCFFLLLLHSAVDCPVTTSSVSSICTMNFKYTICLSWPFFGTANTMK